MTVLLMVGDDRDVVSSYRLRVEALLLKEEFNQTVDWLKPSIDAVIISARGLNSTLRRSSCSESAVKDWSSI